MAGLSRERFRRLGGLLGAMRTPWAVIGDGNMTPEALARSTFVEKVGGVLRVADVVGTCAQKE
eukprot:6960328-Pyramimonas_sp.AAC.1